MKRIIKVVKLSGHTAPLKAENCVKAQLKGTLGFFVNKPFLLLLQVKILSSVEGNEVGNYM